MSLEQASSEMIREPAFALAHDLTVVPEAPLGEVLSEEFRSVAFPVALDRGLGQSYADATSMLPKPIPGVQDVALFVGNASMESAFPILDRPDIVALGCDNNWRTLLAQRILIELIRAHEAIEDYLPARDALINAAVNFFPRKGDFEFSYIAQTNGVAHQQNRQIGIWGNEMAPYFLTDELAYTRARAAVLRQPLGFRWMDLREALHFKTLGAQLAEASGRIVLASTTDAFDSYYAKSRGARLMVDALPFASDAVMVSVKPPGTREESVAYRLANWPYLP